MPIEIPDSWTRQIARLKFKAPSSVKVTPPSRDSSSTSLRVLLALSFCHLLNDAIQALIPALYPLLKQSLLLSFTQIGFITFAFQMVGSVFQPLVGYYTDRHPRPYSLVFGMGVTLGGLVILALSPSYAWVLIAACMVGLGSAVFHPESSRIARLASGGRHGFAQSLFQVGGNAGTALGPLLAAWMIMPYGQRYVLWFSLLAFVAIGLLSRLGAWYQYRLLTIPRRQAGTALSHSPYPTRTILIAMSILLALMFSKFFYLAAMTNYYTFYLMHRYGLGVSTAQFYLFLFLAGGVVGVLVGGIVGDRIGRRQIIWLSILAPAPLAVLMPEVDLGLGIALSIVIGFMMASAFPAILVYATELLPEKIGLIAGLFFGLAFGLAGIGAAVLGRLADATSVEFVMKACSFLPLMGLLTWFLPRLESRTQHPS